MLNLLEIKNLSCGYGNKFNITGIDVDIAKGSFVGIIGPNGCGKTTLLRGITGELKSITGTLMLNSRELNHMSLKEKARKLAVVAQDIETPYMQVLDYILMGRLPFRKNYQFFDTKEDYSIAEKYMNMTGVSHLQAKYLSQLSGGERQMVAITRALVQEPELLLLDEPTSHLDIAHQVQVLNLLQHLNEQLKLTILMIIHDLNLAGEYCNLLVLMNNGKIHTTGNPEEVLIYKNIEEVYGTIVVTKTNPVSGKPFVFPVSEKALRKMQDSGESE